MVPPPPVQPQLGVQQHKGQLTPMPPGHCQSISLVVTGLQIQSKTLQTFHSFSISSSCQACRTEHFSPGAACFIGVSRIKAGWSRWVAFVTAQRLPPKASTPGCCSPSLVFFLPACFTAAGLFPGPLRDLTSFVCCQVKWMCSFSRPIQETPPQNFPCQHLCPSKGFTTSIQSPVLIQYVMHRQVIQSFIRQTLVTACKLYGAPWSL